VILATTAALPPLGHAQFLSVFDSIFSSIQSDIGSSLSSVNQIMQQVSLGENPSCYKGSISLADRKHPVRHLIAASQELHANGAVGRTILMRYERDEAWATLVSFLGLPGEPTWAAYVLGVLEAEKRIKELDGIGCRPVLVSATTEELLDWIGDGLRSRALDFPERNGPIVWPRFSLDHVLRPIPAENLPESPASLAA
jgi:hypothetical protein